MIKFQNTTRRYGKKTAVDDLSLSIPQGELFTLLGPNGAGKTTAIKMLIGLLRPDSGVIRIGDCDVADPSRRTSKMIGYVPDQPFLYDKLSGREFLHFVGEMRGMAKDDIEQEIELLDEPFEFLAFLDHLTETYSHGMKQRVVFASAMLHRPPVLVIDEPMVGLDPKSVRMVKNLLRSRVGEGTTVFMSTHTLAVAEEIADRIGILFGGRIRFLGDLEALRAESLERDASLEELFLELTGRYETTAEETP